MPFRMYMIGSAPVYTVQRLVDMVQHETALEVRLPVEYIYGPSCRFVYVCRVRR